MSANPAFEPGPARGILQRVETELNAYLKAEGPQEIQAATACLADALERVRYRKWLDHYLSRKVHYATPDEREAGISSVFERLLDHRAVRTRCQNAKYLFLFLAQHANFRTRDAARRRLKSAASFGAEGALASGDRTYHAVEHENPIIRYLMRSPHLSAELVLVLMQLAALESTGISALCDYLGVGQQEPALSLIRACKANEALWRCLPALWRIYYPAGDEERRDTPDVVQKQLTIWLLRAMGLETEAIIDVTGASRSHVRYCISICRKKYREYWDAHPELDLPQDPVDQEET